MRLRNNELGYGLVTKTSHWAAVAALAAQFVVGYLMEAGENGRGRGRGRGGESGQGRGRGGGYDVGDETLLTLHVALGITILVLAVGRTVWRLATPLPPWAPTLSKTERTLSHWTERFLLALMFLIPSTGLWLVIADDDQVVGLHVASHVAFFVVAAIHVSVVLKHQLFRRDRLLRRMLW